METETILAQIKEMVEEALGIEDISIKNREQRFVVARCVYVKLARKHTFETYANIGKAINRNHATIIHLEKAFETHMNYEKEAITAYRILNFNIKKFNIQDNKTKLYNAIYKLPFDKYDQAIENIEKLTTNTENNETQTN